MFYIFSIQNTYVGVYIWLPCKCKGNACRVYVYWVLFLSPVSTLTLTPTKLVLGTYDGLIHLFCWLQIRSSSSLSLDIKHSESLSAHNKAVYSLICVCSGSVSQEGLTSFCPTFVGRCIETIPKEFLISVGYGKHSVVPSSKNTSSLFKSLTLKAGVCLHVWMI